MKRLLLILTPVLVAFNGALIGTIAPYVGLFLASFFVMLWLVTDIDKSRTPEKIQKLRRYAIEYVASLMLTITILSVWVKFFA